MRRVFYGQSALLLIHLGVVEMGGELGSRVIIENRTVIAITKIALGFPLKGWGKSC